MLLRLLKQAKETAKCVHRICYDFCYDLLEEPTLDPAPAEPTSTRPKPVAPDPAPAEPPAWVAEGLDHDPKRFPETISHQYEHFDSNKIRLAVIEEDASRYPGWHSDHVCGTHCDRNLEVVLEHDGGRCAWEQLAGPPWWYDDNIQKTMQQQSMPWGPILDHDLLDHTGIVGQPIKQTIMKGYLCASFEEGTSLGMAAMAVAIDEKHARQLFDDELKKQGLRLENSDELVEIDLHTPGVTLKSNIGPSPFPDYSGW